MSLSHPLPQYSQVVPAVPRAETHGVLIQLSCVQWCIGASEARSASKSRSSEEGQQSRRVTSRREGVRVGGDWTWQVNQQFGKSQ